eukprot:jgi/Psemu1/303548/fgenesh1_kg.111_\
MAVHDRARKRRQQLLYYSASKTSSSTSSKTTKPSASSSPPSPGLTNETTEFSDPSRSKTTAQTSGSSVGTDCTLTSSENTGNTDHRSSSSKSSDTNKIIDSIIQPMGAEEPSPKEPQQPQPQQQQHRETSAVPLPPPTRTVSPPSAIPGKVLADDEAPFVVPNGDGEPEPEPEQNGNLLTELPENLSVLFVDDDMILRKLFSRTLKKANPTWMLKEASSGEIAIELICSQQDDGHGHGLGDGQQCGFDLIFMDQYMASVQKQLLGTETVRAIRAKGFYKPIICGLSANDVEDAFYHAGSDAFMFKPFPCKLDELKTELLRIINTRRRGRHNNSNSSSSSSSSNSNNSNNNSNSNSNSNNNNNNNSAS